MINNYTKLIACILLLGTAINLQAQTLNAPTPVDNPNIPGNSVWSAVCASDNFNEYFVNFTWGGSPLVNGDNEFILEISDSEGAFDNATELARIADKNTEFDFDIGFSIPETTQGENFRLRVRSTSPAVNGTPSDAFSMYFLSYNGVLLFSPDASGTIPSGGVITLCDGGVVTLGIHNLDNPEIYNYNWYRSGTLLTESGPNISVSDPGVYQVFIDYGSCSDSGGGSNSITLETGTSSGLEISADGDTTLCNGDTVTLIANITGQGYTYTWYKNNTSITSPEIDASTYVVDASEANFEGEYTVEISGDGICIERATAITINSAAGFSATRANDENLVLLPAQTVTLSAETNATTPSYQWYFNGNMIPNATQSTYEADVQGVYYAAISDGSSPCAGITINTEQTNVVVPDELTLSIAIDPTYIECETTSTVISIETITAVVGANSFDVTSSLTNAFTFQWNKEGIAINNETGSMISIASSSENGAYTLTAVLDALSIESNEISVVLNSGESIDLSATGTQYCEGVPLELSTSFDLSNTSFEWRLDGTNIDSSSTVLSVSETGTYQLVVTTDGCPLLSNEIEITPFDASQITLDPGTTLVFVEGESETISAAGGDAYEWYDSTNNIIGTGSSVTIEAAGNYLLLATIGNCQVGLEFTAEYRDAFAIPNVVTANGDGANDQWIIPNSYSRQNEVNVTIYNENGEVVVDEFAYQNDWPASNTSFTKRSQLFYYKIRKEGKTLKQGTITVIR